MIFLECLALALMSYTVHKFAEIQKKQKLIEELLQNSNVKEIRRQLQKKLQKMREEHLQKVESYNTLRQNIVNVRFFSLILLGGIDTLSREVIVSKLCLPHSKNWSSLNGNL